MKSRFQSKSLHLTACILLFWKGISVITWLLLEEAGILEFGENLFFSTGFMSSFSLVVVAAFSNSRTFSLFVLAVIGVTFLAYWVFFVLLARNRSRAGVASAGLLVFCGLDLPITVAWSFAQWWSIIVCVAFHTAIFITIVLLRRSRPGFSLVLSKIPESI